MSLVANYVLMTLAMTGVMRAAPPVFQHPDAATTKTIPETMEGGEYVDYIEASDPDGSDLTFSIDSQTPSSPVFTLSDKKLYSPGGLNAATTSSFDIVFSVNDGSTTVLSGVLTVSISDVNEKPVFSPTTYTGNVLETASAGHAVVTVTATDPDHTSPNNVISYSITGGNTGVTFGVTPAGLVTVLVPGNLDATGTPSYTLTVQVQDTPGLTADTDATVTINVLAPCSPNPCQNSGTCAISGTSYACTCASGWSGTTCTTADPCSPNPCLNSGTCVSSGVNYACTCVSSWLGTTCDTANPCSPNPCLNSGTCASLGASYACTCASSWSGTTCNTEDSGAGSMHSLTSKCHIYVYVILVVLYMFGAFNS